MRRSTFFAPPATARNLLPDDALSLSARLLRGAALLAVVMGGCRMFSGSAIRSPLSYRQEVKEIEKLVPRGTPREEAVARLKRAGIVGEYSPVGRSIYHCLLWNRPDGERWHLHVALLFNEQDAFYAVQPSDTSVSRDASAGRSSDNPTTADTGAPTSSPPALQKSAAQKGRTISWPANVSSGPSAADADPSDLAAGRTLPTDARSGRRSPFGEISP